MMLPLLLAFQQAAAAPAQPQAAPAIRLVVTPASPRVTAGDTIRLRAQALDAQGKPVADARIRYGISGGYFEGGVDSTGLVTVSSVGTVPVVVSAVVPGSRPVTQRVEVHGVPGPAARLALDVTPRKLLVGQTLRIGATAFSKAGDVRTGDRASWTSSAPAIVRVEKDGALVGVAAGRATITAQAGDATQSFAVQVVPAGLRSVTLTPAVSEARTGDVLRFTVNAVGADGRPVEGLTPTWLMAPGKGEIGADGAFVGYEPGTYTVTALVGPHAAATSVRLADRDVGRRATVVGHLTRSRFWTEEVWLHPNGEVVYLGSGNGGDVLYVIDVKDPESPGVVDSLVVNTRRINDVMTTPDGRWMVFTREGSSDRKDGIVIASLEDPRHPRIVTQYTEGITSGVHSAFIYKDPRHGTHVFATNDGTGAVHVINIDDPTKPKTVAVWKTDRPDAGRSLHDVDVQDGLLYGAWWNDGLVILDVGNGVKGGTPAKPVMVSQFKYDLDQLYERVERQRGGKGFIRGTHTAWRHRNYVIIADEVVGNEDIPRLFGNQVAQTFGRLQVVDVSDIEKPKAVAYYEPEYGGVHNVWVAGDSLYVGAYNAGFRVFDISGELRGDLRAQGREIAHVQPTDPKGFIPNAAMTWGAVVKNGLAYVNDLNSGLWIVRIEPKDKVVP